jgi:hypothetical protein
MQRAAIGILTIGLFVLSAVWPLVQPDNDGTLSLACVRVAIVLGALWLAYPQASRLPPWKVAAVILPLAVLAARPKLIWALLRPKVLLVAIPLLALLYFLRPRKRR